MKFLGLFLAITFSLNALAAYTPTSTKSNTEASKVETFNVQVPGSQVTTTSPKTRLIETGNDNQLVNPGFEHSTYDTGWVATTTSGSVTRSQETSLQMPGGKNAMKLVMTSWVGTICQTVTNASKMFLSGVSTLNVAPSSNTGGKVCALVDAAEQACNDINNNSSSYTQIDAPFVSGATSYGVCFKQDVASSGTVYLDDASTGKMPAGYVQQLSQSRVAFHGNFPSTSGATEATTSTTFVTPATTAAIPGPTVISSDVCSLQTTDANLFQWTANSCKPGKYIHRVSVKIDSTLAGIGCIRLTDGTNNGVQTCGLPNTTTHQNLTAYLEASYTSTQNVTITAQAKTALGTITLSADGADVEFLSTFYPLASEVVAGRCDDPRKCEAVMSWRSTSGSPAVVSLENLDWVNGNGTRPANGRFVFDISPAGLTVLPACQATPSLATSFTTNSCYVDSSTSTTTSLEIRCSGGGAAANPDFLQIDCVKSGADYTASKLNYNFSSLAEVPRAPGTTRPKTCYLQTGGAGSITAQTVCTGSPCTEYLDTCGTLSMTRAGTGDYLLVGAAGTCKASSRLWCNVIAGNNANYINATLLPASTTFSTDVNGGFSFDFDTFISGGGAANTFQNSKCECEFP